MVRVLVIYVFNTRGGARHSSRDQGRRTSRRVLPLGDHDKRGQGMNNEIQPVEIKPRATMVHLPTWGNLRVRAGRIGITPQQLAVCMTLDEFRRLVKRAYRNHVRTTRKHPDLRFGTKTSRKAGVHYHGDLRTYEWLMGLEEDDIRNALKVRETVPDPEPPMDWAGWEAYSTYYAGFQIGRL